MKPKVDSSAALDEVSDGVKQFSRTVRMATWTLATRRAALRPSQDQRREREINDGLRERSSEVARALCRRL